MTQSFTDLSSVKLKGALSWLYGAVKYNCLQINQDALWDDTDLYQDTLWDDTGLKNHLQTITLFKAI